MAETQTPDYQSADFKHFTEKWQKVDDCLGGTETMRAAGGKKNGKVAESPYLPQFPLEADDSYLYRLETSTFLPAYGDGLNRIVGAITRKPPTLSADVPPNIAADWDNIDNAGTKWAVKAQQLLRTGVHHGGASYTEAPGTSLSERREWIALLEKHLHEMGASLFTEGSQKSGMTATEVRERGGSQQSRISQIADAWHDCLENVLIWFARWKGEEPKGAIIPGVKASDLVVTPADLPALSQMVERGQHSRKTLWAIEKKLGILLDDFSDDQEYRNLEDEQRRLGGAAGAQLDRLLNRGGIE